MPESSPRASFDSNFTPFAIHVFLPPVTSVFRGKSKKYIYIYHIFTRFSPDFSRNAFLVNPVRIITKVLHAIVRFAVSSRFQATS